MTLPNFIGIGAQRAGTTWLYERLREQPGVFLPAQKELHFFDERPDFSGYQGLGKPGQRKYFDPNDAAAWPWYQAQFEPGRGFAVRGEITPFYATLSNARVALMAQELPDLKIVYVIRDPVQRAWSGFKLFWFLETKHRECALDNDEIRKTIMHPAKLVHGDYRRNTAAYESVFPADRIIYLFYDDLVREPAALLAKLFGFLGIESNQVRAEKTDAGPVNKTPAFPLPAEIERELSAYYADQLDFIRAKFGRKLEL